MSNLRPLKFCLLNTFYPPYHFGGDAVCVRQLAHALAARGHRVDVIHDLDAFAGGNRGKMHQPQPLPQPHPEPDGVRVHRLRSRLGRLSSLATQQSGRPIVHGRRIAQILRDGRFDVIHFHNVSLLGGPGLLAYGEGIKLYTAHEHWLVCPTHSLWRKNREACTGRQCLSCVLQYRRPPQYWRYTGLLKSKARHIDAFISPSDFSARLHQQFGFDRPFSVIPNFVADVDPGAEPAETRAQEPHVRPYFLFVGRLERMKGLHDLLPHFSTTGPADLLVAGTGTNEAELRAACGQNSAIRFLGHLTPEELRPVYRHALGVVVPSLCYETFGMVTIEAFRERTPVIARAVGPLQEIISESGGGLLFNTSDQLAEALRRLANDSSLRDQLAAAGYSSLRERWTQRVVLERYLDLIRDVACRKGLTDLCDILDARQEAEPTPSLSVPAVSATADQIPASCSFPSDRLLGAPTVPYEKIK